MNKFFRNTLALGVSAILSVPCTAQAFTVYYPGGDSGFLLSGNTGISRAGQPVTVSVTDEEDGVLFVRRVLTDKNGSYSLDFELDAYGDAVVNVTEGANVCSPAKVYKSTDAEIADALRLINTESSIADIVRAAQEESEEELTAVKVLQIDMAEFDELNSDGAFAIALDSEKYDTIADFNSGYSVAKFLSECANTDSAKALSELMKQYAAGYDESMAEQYALYLAYTNKNAFDIFEAYKDTEREEILSGMYGKAYDGFGDFWNVLFEKVVISELNKLYNYSEKFAVADANNDFLELDFDKYEELDDYYTKFKKEVFSKTYSDVDELKKQCEESFERFEEKKEDDGKSSSKGSGKSSGGVGGGSRQSITVDKSLEPEIVSPEPFKMFTDISGHAWAAESIEALGAKGIVAGKGNRLFAPDDYITRAEFVKIIVGALEIESDGETLDFSDVPTSHWAYDYVKNASGAGVVNGISDDEFGTELNITREDMAVMCLRAVKHKGISADTAKTLSFADEKQISDYAKEAVGIMSAMGIINGRENNSFCPKELLTRAEAAKVIYLLMSK